MVFAVFHSESQFSNPETNKTKDNKPINLQNIRHVPQNQSTIKQKLPIFTIFMLIAECISGDKTTNQQIMKQQPIKP